MLIEIRKGKNKIGGYAVEISTESTRILLDSGYELKAKGKKEESEAEGLLNCADFDALLIPSYNAEQKPLAYQNFSDTEVYIGETSYNIIKEINDKEEEETFIPKDFLRHNESITVGDIKITPYFCGNITLDSFMLLFEDGNERVLYSGYFKAVLGDDFNELLKLLPEKVDKLICKNKIMSDKGYFAAKEEELQQKATELFRQTKGPIFLLQSSANIERLIAMYNAATNCERIFLEDTVLANIARTAGKYVPNPSSENLFENVYVFSLVPQRKNYFRRFERAIFNRGLMAKYPFVMCVRSSMMVYLRTLSMVVPFKEGVLVYSYSDVYKNSIDMKRFLAECERLGLKIIDLQVSNPKEEQSMIRLINRVNPKTILPIHNDYAARFKEHFPNIEVELRKEQSEQAKEAALV